MSFGCSVGDAILLIQLVRNGVQNARRAYEDYSYLEREISSLENVLSRIENEREGMREEQQALLQDPIDGCRVILRRVYNVLVKYGALGDKGNGVRSGLKKLWQMFKFGNGELKDLADIRAKLDSYKISLHLLLILPVVTMETNVVEGISKAVGRMFEAQASSTRETSVENLNAPFNEDWGKSIFRELAKEHFPHDLMEKHRDVIKACVKEVLEHHVSGREGGGLESKERGDRAYENIIGESGEIRTTSRQDDKSATSAIPPGEGAGKVQGSRPIEDITTSALLTEGQNVESFQVSTNVEENSEWSDLCCPRCSDSEWFTHLSLCDSSESLGTIQSDGFIHGISARNARASLDSISSPSLAEWEGPGPIVDVQNRYLFQGFQMAGYREERVWRVSGYVQFPLRRKEQCVGQWLTWVHDDDFENGEPDSDGHFSREFMMKESSFLRHVRDLEHYDAVNVSSSSLFRRSSAKVSFEARLRKQLLCLGCPYYPCNLNASKGKETNLWRRSHKWGDDHLCKPGERPIWLFGLCFDTFSFCRWFGGWAKVSWGHDSIEWNLAEEFIWVLTLFARIYRRLSATPADSAQGSSGSSYQWLLQHILKSGDQLWEDLQELITGASGPRLPPPSGVSILVNYFVRTAEEEFEQPPKEFKEQWFLQNLGIGGTEKWANTSRFLENVKEWGERAYEFEYNTNGTEEKDGGGLDNHRRNSM